MNRHLSDEMANLPSSVGSPMGRSDKQGLDVFKTAPPPGTPPAERARVSASVVMAQLSGGGTNSGLEGGGGSSMPASSSERRSSLGGRSVDDQVLETGQRVTAFPSSAQRVTTLPHRGGDRSATGGVGASAGIDVNQSVVTATARGQTNNRNAVAAASAGAGSDEAEVSRTASTRKKKTLPHRPTSFVTRGPKTTAAGVASPSAEEASPPPKTTTPPKFVLPPPASPRATTSAQPLLHMDVAALPLSSPLASMAVLGGTGVGAERASRETKRKQAAKNSRLFGRWGGSKRKGPLTKDMIGLPESFKHVSHTAPQDVGPLLSALQVSDFGVSR
jgi:hypothetical protein